MFACPGLIFYTVCSVPWLDGNLALAEKCCGPLRFRLRQVLLYVLILSYFLSVLATLNNITVFVMEFVTIMSLEAIVA